MKVLVAGATGAIGRPLIRLLKESGHAVFGLARSFDAERALVEMGAEAVNGDALDAASVKSAIQRIRPDAIINGISTAGKISFGIAKNATNPISIMSAAIATIVMGRLSASATIHKPTTPRQRYLFGAARTIRWAMVAIRYFRKLVSRELPIPRQVIHRFAGLLANRVTARRLQSRRATRHVHRSRHDASR